MCSIDVLAVECKPSEVKGVTCQQIHGKVLKVIAFIEYSNNMVP